MNLIPILATTFRLVHLPFDAWLSEARKMEDWRELYTRGCDIFCDLGNLVGEIAIGWCAAFMFCMSDI